MAHRVNHKLVKHTVSFLMLNLKYKTPIVFSFSYLMFVAIVVLLKILFS